MAVKRNEFRRHQQIVQQTLLMLYFLLSYNGAQGEKKLSKLEDAELEKEVKLLNKPTVKTIKTKYGDIYDCVDFYKQHAFDHPLLKDHNFYPKMKPTLSRMKKKSKSSTVSRSSSIWSKDRGCPFGTVPVKRITKDDLIRQRRMPPPENVTFDTQFDGSNNNSKSKGRYISSQGYKLAIARIPNNPNNRFAGAGMAASLYNPYVKGQQHSGCRLKIQKESDILQVGWRVDPTLYGDTKTRHFIHFQAGKSHCFNTLCPGFVQVNSEIPLGSAYDVLSERGKTSWETTMYIDRDLANGNWWLLDGRSFDQIGFWPQRIFTDLASFATNVEWGGVAYSPPGVPEPPMGSSFFPIKNSLYDGYCTEITILNEKGKEIKVDETITHTDNPTMYKVFAGTLSHGFQGLYFVLYGGPGESPHI
ncbi:protein neprosin-like [Lycium barbarum]|uniref:protein neprosin-like n=1 Tax=Lycium barbarum TaxID=112863 RepID=UPI00293E67CF|nr:protein neprosin-like [Lycium barbarum]